jgi:hypothetical protein
VSRAASSVGIIFPPQFEPFQAYLSGPYLKSLLARCGVRTSVFDANIDFYEWLVAQAQKRTVWPMAANDSAGYLRDHVGQAVDLLRSGPRSVPEYRWAINVADEYLRAISPEGLKIGLAYLQVGKRHSASDLDAYVARSNNILRLYFDYASDSLLGPPGVSTYLLSLVVIDQLAAAVVFAREIKQRRPGARVVIGGPAVSRLYRQLMRVPWIVGAFDAIVPGEAYRSLPGILGLSHVYDGHVAPDFSDLNLDSYWSCRRVLPYLVAHGCKWGRCAFCSHHLTYDGYRESRISEVLADLDRLAAQQRVQYISFCDEYLTPDQLDELSGGLLERQIDLRWSTFARPEPQFRDREFVMKLYAAGCRMLMFGLESGSQRVLNAMRKGTRVASFRPILEACKAANIAGRYDFMVGFPGETEQDIQETYSFIRQNREVIDTPFSSYAVAVFELRSGIPVLEQAERFHVLAKSQLRGELDDQYEFQGDGLSEQARIEWRERLIRFFKTEMDAELICPQNKTHQLVLKDLYDAGVLDLPVLQVRPERFKYLTATLAPGVELVPVTGGVRVVNHANGGELEASLRLVSVLRGFEGGLNLDCARRSQDLWDQERFARFVTFLYRNDYVFLRDDARKVRHNGPWIHRQSAPSYRPQSQRFDGLHY